MYVMTWIYFKLSSIQDQTQHCSSIRLEIINFERQLLHSSPIEILVFWENFAIPLTFTMAKWVTSLISYFLPINRSNYPNWCKK